MLLGAAGFQVPTIKYALNAGYNTIVCDNNLLNPGHKLAHKSYNVSTRDKDEVLRIAKDEKIDGILSFGSDISMPTVAYVCEKLNLPGNPSETIHILTNKGLFRNFLENSGIQKTKFKVFCDGEAEKVIEYIESQNQPLVIKPVDSSGSKGTAIIRNQGQLKDQIDNAYNESFSRSIIVEEFFEKNGFQVCGDGYFENGKIKFMFFGDGHYYNDGLHMAPWGETFPSSHSIHNLQRAETKIESILNAAGFIKGPFNVDVLIKNDCFIVEIGPRSGGNFISRAIELKYGVDLVMAGVESALDRDWIMDVSNIYSHNYYGCYMVHSPFASGKFEGINIADNLKGNVHEINNYISYGEIVNPFLTARNAVANIIFRFDTFKEMVDTYPSISNRIKITLS